MKDPKHIEPKFQKLNWEEWNDREEAVPKGKYDSLKESRETERKEFLNVLDNVHWGKVPI